MVQAMKQMAAEMHNELEATRNELRRGVLEMPQEAADNTAQMRKVIVDQIEALAELNRIVAHHGRGLDVVTSGRANVQRQEEPVMAAAPSSRNEVRMRDASSASTLPPPDLGVPARAPRRSPAGLAGRRRSGRMAVRPAPPHRRRRRTASPWPRAADRRPIRWSRCRSTSAG